MYRFIQKARLPATRILLNRNVVQLIRRQPALTQWQQRSFHVTIKNNASSSDWQQPPPPPPTNHPLIQQLQEHPHIMEQLAEFTDLLTTKGVDVSGKKPSFMQVNRLVLARFIYLLNNLLGRL